MFDLGKISCDDCLSRPTSGMVVRCDDESVLLENAVGRWLERFARCWGCSRGHFCGRFAGQPFDGVLNTQGESEDDDVRN